MLTAEQIARWRSQPKTPQRTATITHNHHAYNLAYRKKTLHTIIAPDYEVGHAVTSLQRLAKQQGFTHVKQGKYTHKL